MRRSQYFDKKERGRQLSKEIPANMPIRAMPMSTSKYKEHALNLEARSDIGNTITPPFSMYELDSRGTTPKTTELERKIARTIQELETEITKAKIKIQEKRPGTADQGTFSGRERGRSLGPLKTDSLETSLLSTSPIKQSQSISHTSQANKCQTAKQSLYSLLRNNGIELTKYLREGISNIFDSLSSQLYVPREYKEKSENIGDSMKIYATMYNNMKLDAEYNAKTMKFDREEIERGLEKLKQQAFRQSPYKDYDTHEYSSKKRSSSQAMRGEDDNLNEMILDTKSKINKFFEKLQKSDTFTAQYDEIIKKKDQLIQSILNDRGGESSVGEFDSIKKKDEQIKKMQLELDAVSYLLKRKKEEQAKLKDNSTAICDQVQKFLSSMQRLQRAVAKQDSMNLTALKDDFEANKKELIALAKSSSTSSPFETPGKAKELIEAETSSAPIAKYKVKQVGSQSQLQELERKIKEYEINNARLMKDMNDLVRYKTDAQELEIKLNDQDIIIKTLRAREEHFTMEKNHITALVQQKERENVVLNEMMERMTQDSKNKKKENVKKIKNIDTRQIKEEIMQRLQEILENKENEMNKQLSILTEQEEKIEEIYKALDYYKLQRKDLNENAMLIQELQTEKELLQEELQKVKSDYEKMQLEKSGIINDETNYENIKQQQEELRNMIVEKSTEIEASLGQFQKLQSDYEVLQQDLLIKDNEIEKLRQGLNEAQESNKIQIQELKNINLSAKNEKEELSKQIDIQSQSLKKLEEENEDLSKKNEQLNEKIEEDLSKIKDRENQNEQLKLQVSQLEKYKRQAASVPKLKLKNMSLQNSIIQQEKRLGTELKRIAEIIQKTCEGSKNAEKLLEGIQKTKELQNSFAEQLKAKLASYKTAVAKNSEESFELLSQLQAKEEEKNVLKVQNEELTNKLNELKSQYDEIKNTSETTIVNLNKKINGLSVQPLKESIVEIKEMFNDQTETFIKNIKTKQSQFLLLFKKWEEKKKMEKRTLEQKIEFNEKQNTGTLQDLLKEKQRLQEKEEEYQDEINSLKAQLAAEKEAKIYNKKLILGHYQTASNKIMDTIKRYQIFSKDLIARFDKKIEIIKNESEAMKTKLINANNAYNDLKLKMNNTSEQVTALLKVEEDKNILNTQVETLSNKLDEANNRFNEVQNLSENQKVIINKFNNVIHSINIQPVKEILLENKSRLNEEIHAYQAVIENIQIDMKTKIEANNAINAEKIIFVEKQHAQVLQELLKEKQNLEEQIGDIEEKMAAQKAEFDQQIAEKDTLITQAKRKEYNLIMEYHNLFLSKISQVMNKYESIYGDKISLLNSHIESSGKIKEKLLIMKQEYESTKLKLKDSQDAYNDLKLKMNFTSEQLAELLKIEEEKKNLNIQVGTLTNKLNEQNAVMNKLNKKILSLSIEPIKNDLLHFKNDICEEINTHRQFIENGRNEFISRIKINMKQHEEKIIFIEKQHTDTLQELLKEKQNLQERNGDIEENAIAQKEEFDRKIRENEAKMIQTKKQEYDLIKEYHNYCLGQINTLTHKYETAYGQYNVLLDQQNRNVGKSKEKIIIMKQESEAMLKNSQDAYNDLKLKMNFTSEQLAESMKVEEEKKLLNDQVVKLRAKLKSLQALLSKLLNLQPIKSSLSNIISENSINAKIYNEKIENMQKELLDMIKQNDTKLKCSIATLQEKNSKKEKECEDLMIENKMLKDKINDYESKAAEEKYIFEEKITEYETKLESKRKEDNLIKQNIILFETNFKTTENINQEVNSFISTRINNINEQIKNLQKAKDELIISRQTSEGYKIKLYEYETKQKSMEEITLKMHLAAEKLANLFGISDEGKTDLINLVEQACNEIHGYRSQKEKLIRISPDYSHFEELELKFDLKTKDLQNKYLMIFESVKLQLHKNTENDMKLKQELHEKDKTIKIIEAREKRLNDELIKIRNFIQNTKDAANVQQVKQILLEYEQNLEINKKLLNERINDTQRVFLSQANEISSLRQSISSSKMEDKDTITKIVKEKSVLEMENSKLKGRIDQIEKDFLEYKKNQSAKISKEKQELINKFSAFSQWIIEKVNKNEEYCRISEEKITERINKIWEMIKQLHTNVSIRLNKILGKDSAKGKLNDAINEIQICFITFNKEKLAIKEKLKECECNIQTVIEKAEMQYDKIIDTSSLIEKIGLLNQLIKKYKIKIEEQSQQIFICENAIIESKQKIKEKGEQLQKLAFDFKQYVLNFKNAQANEISIIFYDCSNKIQTLFERQNVKCEYIKTEQMQKLNKAKIEMGEFIKLKESEITLCSDKVNDMIGNLSSSLYKKYKMLINDLKEAQEDCAEKENLLVESKENIQKLTQDHLSKCKNLEVIQNKLSEIVELFEVKKESISTELLLESIENKIRENKTQIEKLTLDLTNIKKDNEKQNELTKNIQDDTAQKLQSLISREESQKLTIQHMEEEIAAKDKKLELYEVNMQVESKKTRGVILKYSENFKDICKRKLEDIENRLALSLTAINKINSLSKDLTSKEKLLVLQSDYEKTNTTSIQQLKEKDKKIEDLQMDQAFSTAEISKQESEITEIKAELEKKTKEYSEFIDQVKAILKRDDITNDENIIAGIEQLIAWYKNAVSQEEDEKESCFTELEQTKALQQELEATLKQKEEEYNEAKLKLLNILGEKDLQEDTSLILIIQKVEEFIQTMHKDEAKKEETPPFEILELQTNYSALEQEHNKIKSAIVTLKNSVGAFIENCGFTKDVNLSEADLPNELEKISNKLKSIQGEHENVLKQLNMDKEISDQKNLEELAKKEEEIVRLKTEYQENSIKAETNLQEQLKGKDQTVFLKI